MCLVFFVISSEWIYWEVLSLIIGTIGVVELSVHTIPTQVVTVLFMVPLGIGIALAIRIGNILPRNPTQARHLCFYGLLVSSLLFASLSVLMYIYRRPIYTLFTTDEEVLVGCEQIWFKVSVFSFLLGIFGINMGIATGLGKQLTLGVVSIIFLWVLGLPASYYFGIIQGGGLNVAWQSILPPYAAINAVLILSFVCADWDDISARIRIREGVTTKKDNINNPLEFDSLLFPENGDGTQHPPLYGALDNNKQL